MVVVLGEAPQPKIERSKKVPTGIPGPPVNRNAKGPSDGRAGIVARQGLVKKVPPSQVNVLPVGSGTVTVTSNRRLV
jgi:hypothetical protein